MMVYHPPLINLIASRSPKLVEAFILMGQSGLTNGDASRSDYEE